MGVLHARLEVEPSIVPREQSREADEHLPERGVHVKVEISVDVVGPELPEVRLVPDDVVRRADTPEPGDRG